MSMSVCASPEEDSSEEAGAGPVRDHYETKTGSTVVRVLTVLAYLLSVSLAAILLSVYYVCVWKAPELPPLNETEGGEVSARRSHDGNYSEEVMPLRLLGGSNLTMRDSSSEEPFESETFEPTSESPEPSDVPPSPPDPPDPEPAPQEPHTTSEDYLQNATNSVT